MKKSKIIGLSLGFSALAAVAIATPFIVTSCSNKTTNSNAITANIETTFATVKSGTAADSLSDLAATNIVTGNNIATIYTGAETNTFVSLVLSGTLNQIISNDVITSNDLAIADEVTVTVAWECTDTNWNFDATNRTLSNKNAISGEPSVKLTAKVTKSTTVANQNPKIEEKTIEVQVTFKNAAKPAN